MATTTAQLKAALAAGRANAAKKKAPAKLKLGKTTTIQRPQGKGVAAVSKAPFAKARDVKAVKKTSPKATAKRTKASGKGASKSKRTSGGGG